MSNRDISERTCPAGDLEHEHEHACMVSSHFSMKTIRLTLRRVQRYDIFALGDEAESETRHDEKGMLASVRGINQIIANELDENPDVPSNRIVVGGFSQGVYQFKCTFV